MLRAGRHASLSSSFSEIEFGRARPTSLLHSTIHLLIPSGEQREGERERTRYRSGRKAREAGGMGEGHKVQRRDVEERREREEEVKKRRGKERVTAALEKYIKHCS